VHGGGMLGFAEDKPGWTPDPSIVRSNGGAGFVPGILRLGIPDLNMADSAVGVTRGAARGRYSTPLPSALANAASWDPGMAYQYGALIGRELRNQGYNVSLGGGVNITREPRNGRNFEYLGEDPVLAGKLDAQFIKGIQDQHIIGDIKHYAVNDQETGRYYGNAKLDRRSMRETDLLAFEIAVKEAKPGMVMCSYNRINGDFACENDYTLNQVLKKAWGFQGWVISDWGGTHSSIKAALNGLDQEQPGNGFFGPDLRRAVEGGQVPMARLNDMVHRILRSMFACGVVDDPVSPNVPDVSRGLEIAQQVAENGSVLLKNDNHLLPLKTAAIRSIAVIGSHADIAVISGGGSAQVDPPGGNVIKEPPVIPKPGQTQSDAEIDAILNRVVWYPSSPLKAIRRIAPAARVQFDPGTNPDSAAALAKASDVAILFANQPSSEGHDLSLALPENQDQLIRAVAAANPRTVVVLETGGPVTMPWIAEVSSVLETWFPGIRGGEAIANVLFGNVNPSAKLPVTFPRNEADLPHPRVAAPAGKFGPLDGIFDTRPPFDIDYSEGLQVGYKWFDAQNKQPLFPFGHGLSYTTFAYSGLEASPRQVTFTVKNTGSVAGTEVSQVYVTLPAEAKEPPKRLVAWAKTTLAPGASQQIKLDLDPMLLSVFDVDKNDWSLLAGDYQISVGSSSRDLALRKPVSIPH
jgi:beta-glucosidase